MAELIVKPMNDKLGNKVEVGESVIFLGSSWGITSARIGKYAGYYKDSYYGTRARINTENVSKWSKDFSILQHNRFFKIKDSYKKEELLDILMYI